MVFIEQIQRNGIKYLATVCVIQKIALNYFGLYEMCLFNSELGLNAFICKTAIVIKKWTVNVL